MTIFDLSFLLAALASLVTFMVVLVFAVQRRWAKVLKILKTYAVCAVVYLGAGVAVSFFRPQRVMRPGTPWCFDDWYLTVEGVSSTLEPAGNSLHVALRVFSRARRVSQRAKGAWLYLIDDRGRLYPPQPDPSAMPLNVLLQPGESITTSRSFHVPAGVRQLGLVTGHGGPYCGAMAILVPGESACLFRKPAMIKIE